MVRRQGYPKRKEALLTFFYQGALHWGMGTWALLMRRYLVSQPVITFCALLPWTLVGREEGSGRQGRVCALLGPCL